MDTVDHMADTWMKLCLRIQMGLIASKPEHYGFKGIISFSPASVAGVAVLRPFLNSGVVFSGDPSIKMRLHNQGPPFPNRDQSLECPPDNTDTMSPRSWGRHGKVIRETNYTSQNEHH
uniref:Uncharacterized protein n=1 Tax=Glossina palpalis gambiensis TaxID=67801 RepID=A0A1B0BTR5_9MUSC